MENTFYPSPSPKNFSTMFPSPSLLPPSELDLCRSSATSILLPTLYALLFITGLPGNALSLWMFQCHIKPQRPTHVYLSHLSVSNLLLSLTTPFLAAYYAQIWPFRGPLCQLMLCGATPILQINIYVGIFILTWVAVSRMAVLVQHTHASRPSALTTLLPQSFFSTLRRANFARIVCGATWVLVVGAILPVTVYYTVREAADKKGGRSRKDGGSEEEGGGGRKKVCYSTTVELGGSLSRGASVAAIVLFFVCFLLVLMSYVAVTRHIRRSRRNAAVTESQRVLGKVFRNIVVIQVVLVVCLMPHHIFKSIFISLIQNQFQAHNNNNHCHPLSTLLEVKNFLLWLAALRGSIDPVMYFLLDKTFHKNTLNLLRLRPQTPSKSSVSGMGQTNLGSGGHKGPVSHTVELSLGSV